ncbi:MAG: di-trans,poly-cis-decaprenylcistransferase [Phycisphaerales bacterium]|nr:di-trans,poly-cis-decaprenylcistransferase [Phycisphaerales bacterium]
MRARNPNADPLGRLPDVHPSRIPRHIAIIMDGNGRWARDRGFPRIFGHRNGATAVRNAVTECGKLGVEVLTLYSFSLENWKRPAEEVQALMDLCLTYCRGEREEFLREGVRFRVIGRRDGLPDEVLRAIDELTDATRKSPGPTLCLAINYGGRAELADAARSIAQRAAAGVLDPNTVDESTIAGSLYASDLPDPDLLIRTAGEMRISNFLLWQISYAELFVTGTYWPDFGPAQLHEAIREYARRRRRFGGLDESPTAT